MPVLTNWQLDLTPEDTLRAMGADPIIVKERRPALWEIAVWAVGEGLPLLAPQVLYQEFSVQSLTHERITLANGATPGQDRLIISGPLVAEHLLGASKVNAMICTIGGMLEETAGMVIEEDTLRGLALDAAGSAAAELLATIASHHFENMALNDGLQCSMPLNPGMIGWPVQIGQIQLFKLLEEEREQQPQFTVDLNEDVLMQPQKTVSLVLGMGENLSQQGRICDYCSMNETCRYQNHYG
jgi:hypothetical protein